MNERYGDHESDALKTAVQAILAEPVPKDAVERTRFRANQLEVSEQAAEDTRARRHVWHSPWARYGGIAVATLLVVFAVFTPSINGQSVAAFASVIEQVRQAESVQWTMVTQMGRQPEIRGTMYVVDNQLRFEQEFGIDATLIQICNLETNRSLILDTHRRIAQSIDVDHELTKLLSNPIPQLRRASSNDGEHIGEELLDSRLTQIFRMNKVDFMGFQGAAEMIIWVDSSDQLPVKIVIRDRSPKSQMMIRFEGFVWNQPLSSELFSLNIPDGYKKGTIIQKPTLSDPSNPAPPSNVNSTQLAEGLLSNDRVPGRIVFGLNGQFVTATMRDPESVPPHMRKSSELRQWNMLTGELMWSVPNGAPFSLAASGDGKTLATSENYELQLRDSSTGRVKYTWSTDKQLSPLAFSPDGTTLAAGIQEWGQQPEGKGQAGGVQLWDLEQHHIKKSMHGDKPTTFVRYSRDGHFLASAPNGGPIRIWDASTGDLVRVFPYGSKCDISPNSELIACMASCPLAGETSDDVRERYDVQIHELLTGTLIQTLVSNDHTEASYVLWIEFSPDGRLIAAANWDGSVKLWDVATGNLVKTITEHVGGTHVAVFTPDGKTLATGSEDRTLRLWNIEETLSR